MSVIHLDSIRFYNGQSSPFQQNFVYTKPDTDFREDNGNAYFSINAPPKSFFSVPFELETSEGGVWRISIHKEISERFGVRGIIRVDANAKLSIIADLEKQSPENLRIQLENAKNDDFEPPAKADKKALMIALAEHLIIKATDNRFAYIAVDDDSARAKGDGLWRKHLRQIIDDFEHENSRRVTERGTTPLRPNNFVAHAYKELGMEVPGDEKFIKAGVQQTEVGELRDTVNKQQRTINVLLEKLEKLVPGEAAPAVETAAAVKR